jgi:hypothetical protein
MARLNSEFNYRYQTVGHTVWAKIENLREFLGGRERAAVLEEVAALKLAAKRAELDELRDNNATRSRILTVQAELLELESFQEVQDYNFVQNREEIACLKRLLAELYETAEQTRIPGYTDEQMFEANAANEFTAVVGREIQAEIIANGRPSPAKLHNAMSNPYTFKALQDAGLIPKEAVLLSPNNDPLRISLVAPEQQHALTQQ